MCAEINKGSANKRWYEAAHSHELVEEVSHYDFVSGRPGSYLVINQAIIELSRVQCNTLVTHVGGRVDLQCRDQEMMPIQRPLGMPDQGPGFRRFITHPPLRVTRLKGAVCAPGGIAIYENFVLGESFSATWEMHQHRHMKNTSEGWSLNDFNISFGSRYPTRAAPTLYIDHQHIDWYGHALLDLISPAWAYEFCKAYMHMGELRAICSQPKYDFVLRMIKALGIPISHVDFIDGPVIYEDLILATKAFQIQEYISPPSFRMWRAMRDRMITEVKLARRRIYISRRLNPTRRLVEEEQIELILRGHDFDIIHPEEYVLEEQVKIFAGASLIAGCSGSNMFNMAFQQDAKAVLLFVSPLLVHYTEQFLISNYPKVELHVLMGYIESDEVAGRPGDVHAAWHIDPEAVRSFLRQWLQGLNEPLNLA